jgi:hypothetical protein
MSQLPAPIVLGTMVIVDVAKEWAELLTSAFGPRWGWALALILGGALNKKTLWCRWQRTFRA